MAARRTPGGPGAALGKDMKTWQRVLTGFFGAIAPNQVGGAQQLVSRATDPSAGYLLANLPYVIGTAMIGLLGAGVLAFVREKNPLKAMALGATAPALILGWAQGHPDTASVSDAAHAELNATKAVIVATASPARVLMQVVPAQVGRPTHLELRGLAVARRPGAELVFVLSTAVAPNAAARAEIRYGLPARDTTYRVPDVADRVYVQVGRERSNPVALTGTQGPLLRLRFTVLHQAAFTGFARAFGIRSARSGGLSPTRVR